jgi:hypothetical protein
LRSRLTTASRQREDRDGGRYAQQLTHRRFPQPDAETLHRYLDCGQAARSTGMNKRKPIRLRLSRAKGFDLQAHSRAAVNVARPGRWGNPFVVGKHGTRAECVDLYTKLLAGYLCISVDRDTVEAQRTSRAFVKRNLWRLRGKNLACWCRGKPCHADVLHKIANKKARAA